ncbi:helix-turn-helix transcriptional regulator [Halanaerobium salsuginis]|uniref:Predicted transcriptional regulator YheO, contains PAS and DNA-binding HTH domains n=1 Tax=Halanaerobium salsuginis TaxID=29563 RepID=A0A1I4K9K5_9FIRM|nr:PAS domain-containing protein [Halanaerobium salsuginis]SFL75485.1 Predicted transcriptional regulator YheO, contains PAS and DNA-binding HTH domains [Halanaerobium salsuginis]
MRVLEAESRKVDPALENIKGIAKSLHQILGEKSEIIIHNLKEPESSVIFIAGELTDRDLGAPVTDLVLRTIKHNSDPADLLNYRIETADGRIFKSSTIFIRDDQQQVVGCLCVNYDITELLMAKNILGNFTALTKKETNNSSSQSENFAKNVDEVLTNLIEQAKAQVDKPIPFLTKEDKLKIIEYLEQRGAFTITKSVDIVAEDLKVSKYTIYNYLKEIKAAD